MDSKFDSNALPGSALTEVALEPVVYKQGMSIRLFSVLWPTLKYLINKHVHLLSLDFSSTMFALFLACSFIDLKLFFLLVLSFFILT